MSNQWFRMYAEVLNDPKVQNLPAELFKIWVNLLCIACNNNGTLPKQEDVSFALRMPLHETKEAFHQLENYGLIETDSETFHIHNWNKRQYKSDNSTERVKRHRKQNRNVTVTPPEQIQNRTDTEDKYNAGEGFEKVYEAGSEIFFDLVTANTSSIHQWITAGCDPDLDIIPEIKRHSGKSIKAWSYFTNGIMQAFSTRTTPLSPVPPKTIFKSFDQLARDKTDLAIEEARKRYAQPS